MVKEAYSLWRLYTTGQPEESEIESIPDALDLTHLEGKMQGSGTFPRDVLEVVAQAYWSSQAWKLQVCSDVDGRLVNECENEYELATMTLNNYLQDFE